MAIRSADHPYSTVTIKVADGTDMKYIDFLADPTKTAISVGSVGSTKLYVDPNYTKLISYDSATNDITDLSYQAEIGSSIVKLDGYPNTIDKTSFDAADIGLTISNTNYQYLKDHNITIPELNDIKSFIIDSYSDRYLDSGYAYSVKSALNKKIFYPMIKIKATGNSDSKSYTIYKTFYQNIRTPTDGDVPTCGTMGFAVIVCDQDSEADQIAAIEKQIGSRNIIKNQTTMSPWITQISFTEGLLINNCTIVKFTPITDDYLMGKKFDDIDPTDVTGNKACISIKLINTYTKYISFTTDNMVCIADKSINGSQENVLKYNDLKFETTSSTVNKTPFNTNAVSQGNYVKFGTTDVAFDLLEGDINALHAFANGTLSAELDTDLIDTLSTVIAADPRCENYGDTYVYANPLSSTTTPVMQLKEKYSGIDRWCRCIGINEAGVPGFKCYGNTDASLKAPSTISLASNQFLSYVSEAAINVQNNESLRFTYPSMFKTSTTDTGANAICLNDGYLHFRIRAKNLSSSGTKDIAQFCGVILGYDIGAGKFYIKNGYVGTPYTEYESGTTDVSNLTDGCPIDIEVLNKAYGIYVNKNLIMVSSNNFSPMLGGAANVIKYADPIIYGIGTTYDIDDILICFTESDSLM